MSIEMKSNIAAIIESWKKKPAQLKQALETGFSNGLRQFEGQRLIREQLSGRKGTYYGLNVGSGIANNSLNVIVTRSGIDTIGKITTASNAWYLKVHQHFNFEGYIRPRNATLLAIPVHPAAKGRWPRDMMGELVFIKRPGGTPILIKQIRRGKGGYAGKVRNIVREDIMYVLKPRVYIPKRLYFFEEFKTYGRDMIIHNITNQLSKVNNAN